MALSKEELKKIKALNTKKGRREQMRFAVGGVRLLEESVGSKLSAERVFYTKAEMTARVEQLLGLLSKENIELTPVSNKEMNQIADTETPQGIMAVFELPNYDLSKLYKPTYRRLLLCDRISDPGNLGTLARSAYAFGFELMIVTENTAELYSSKVVRSSAGALFNLPATKVSISELIEFKKSNDVYMAAATANSESGSNSIERMETILQSDTALILAIGGEAEGLSDDIKQISDTMISIPHTPNVESLNAAVAGSILMNEIYKRDNK